VSIGHEKVGVQSFYIVREHTQALNGVSVSRVLEQDRTFDIFLRVNERARSNLQALGELPLISPSGSAVPLREVARTLFVTYRQRSLVGLALMTAQAFFYNAIFFTYALVLSNFYGVAASSIGYYLLPFAAGNFLGPLLLGRFFDTVGRRVILSGLAEPRLSTSGH